MINGFDRLIFTAVFSKDRNHVNYDWRQMPNYRASKILAKLQKNPNNLLRKLKQKCSYFKHDQIVSIKIKDDSVMNVISRDLDPESRKILSLLHIPQTPLDIFLQSKIPLTSLYRKINRLEDDGLIISAGIKRINKNSKSTIYVNTFDNIAFHVGVESTVILTIKNSVLENSLVYTAMK
jgi:hypothetical protein